LRRILANLIKFRLISRWTWQIAISEGGLQAKRMRGLPVDRARVIANGVDFQRATAASVPREALRHSLGICPETRLLLLFGWEPHIKGVDIAVEAVRRVVQRYPDTVLVVVGREKTESFLNELLGSQRPSWLLTVPPRECVADYFAAADVFLCASRIEGFPYSVLEAMVNRRPVAISDIPGLEWAKCIPNAFPFPPEDGPALAGVIEMLFQRSQQESSERAEHALQYVCSHYSAESWSRNVIDFYKSLLEGSLPSLSV
jgi:glycosyltransferase involved in cell wall biosynthesis